MKKYLALFALILIQGCSSGGGDGSAGTVTNSIVGIWEYTYPGSGCVEAYTIYPTGTWSQTSLDEITSGSYVFEDTVNVGERHAFSVDILHDNGLPDCNGNSEIDVGLSLTLYVSFPSSTVMEWYVAETGGVAEITLTWVSSPF
jgi:hypothetical protein